MLKNYFLIAVRNIKRSKVYSFINITGLSLGLACAMLIILYVKDEVSYDRFLSNIDNVYRVAYRSTNPDGSEADRSGISGYLQGPRFTAAIPEIKEFVRFQEHRVDVKKKTEVVSETVFKADSSFFSIFSFPLLKGNRKEALLHPKSVVLSETMAKKEFGTTDAIGKVMEIKNEEGNFEPYRVSAIAKDCPQNSTIKFDMLLPFIAGERNETTTHNWFNFFLNTFIVLQPGADVEAVNKKMQAFFEKDAEKSILMMRESFNMQSAYHYFLQPFTAIHLSKDLVATNGLADASNPAYSYILSGIAFFILLIACINFVNLTIARSVKRSKEIGVRKVVGGDRKQLIVQFLGESMILCFIAFIMAVVIVYLTLPFFNKLASKELSITYLLNTKLITSYIVLFLVTGVLAGFYPALILSRYNPVATLYNRFKLAGKNYLQKSLVVLQFSLATFLIIATLAVYAQFRYLSNKPLGYDDKDLFTVTNREMQRSGSKLFKEKLLNNPAITQVTQKNSGSWSTVAKVNGEQEIHFSYETIDEDYLPTLKIPTVQGRNFSKDYPVDSTRSVLVNESFVKEAGWKEPIGEQVNFWYNKNETFTVVGVVKDYHFESLTAKIRPQVFTMKPGNGYGKMLIKLNPGTLSASLPFIERTHKELFPFAPYHYGFVNESNGKLYAAEDKWRQIMLFAAVITIFISSIGLFGLSVLSAERKIKEIGVRKVLGASVGRIATQLSASFLKLVSISLLIAIPLAWLAANKWLSNYPYRIELGWTLFIMGGLFVILIALLTVSFQSIKAALANPVKSLRTE